MPIVLCEKYFNLKSVAVQPWPPLEVILNEFCLWIIRDTERRCMQRSRNWVLPNWIGLYLPTSSDVLFLRWLHHLRRRQHSHTSSWRRRMVSVERSPTKYVWWGSFIHLSVILPSSMSQFSFKKNINQRVRFFTIYSGNKLACTLQWTRTIWKCVCSYFLKMHPQRLKTRYSIYIISPACYS